MKHKVTPIIFCVLQILSIIWYKRPQIRTGGYDAAGVASVVEFVMFGIFNLVLIGVFIIIFFTRKKPRNLIWKIPFVLFFILLIIFWV